MVCVCIGLLAVTLERAIVHAQGSQQFSTNEHSVKLVAINCLSLFKLLSGSAKHMAVTTPVDEPTAWLSTGPSYQRLAIGSYITVARQIRPRSPNY